MNQRSLGRSGILVSALGLGCMGMSEFYGPADDAVSLATLARAAEIGITLFDTADMYGSGHNETLLGRFLATHRDRAVIATKFGIVRNAGQYARTIDSRPEYVRTACEASLKRLGIDTIDLYYAHRINPDVPIEETVGAMADLVASGKVRALGLSEVSPATLRRAHAVHPISALQTEYSLWTRDPEGEVLDTCRALGIAFVAYSPLGRGILTGTIDSTETLCADDYRRQAPRFQGENFNANMHLVNLVRTLAAAKDCTPAQLALAWLLHQGDDIIPIPGTRHIERLEENVGATQITLSATDLSRLDAALPRGAAIGARYTEEGMKGVNA
jgi:aryl-alcohol dehydrogenase-like predicted oxidoreductase